MTKEELIKKWLNDQLTDAEKKVLEAESDHVFNSKIVESAEKFKASHTSQVDSFDEFNAHYKSNKNKVKKLPLLQYALRLIHLHGKKIGV